MQRLNCIKIICCLNTISLVIIIIFNQKDIKNNSFFNLIINSTTSRSIKISFQDERINQLLASYSHMYEDLVGECNTTKPLTDRQKNVFDIIAIKLATLRYEMIPYPNEYFHGRGIVLTTGRAQLNFAKLNLK